MDRTSSARVDETWYFDRVQQLRELHRKVLKQPDFQAFEQISSSQQRGGIWDIQKSPNFWRPEASWHRTSTERLEQLVLCDSCVTFRKTVGLTPLQNLTLIRCKDLTLPLPHLWLAYWLRANLKPLPAPGHCDSIPSFPDINWNVFSSSQPTQVILWFLLRCLTCGVKLWYSM